MARPTRPTIHIVGPLGRLDTQVTTMAHATPRDPRPARTGPAIILATTGLLAVLVAPTASAAPDGDQGVTGQPGDGAVEVQVSPEGTEPSQGTEPSEAQGTSEGTEPSEAQGTSEGTEPSEAQGTSEGTGPSEAQGTSAGAGDLEVEGDLAVADHLHSVDAVFDLAASCDDHLVTLTPEGASGPAPAAVAITAQAHEWGQQGWDLASWAAAGTTTIRTVIATSADGGTSQPEPGATGTVYDTIALTFCGDVEVANDDTIDAPEADDTADDTATDTTAETAVGTPTRVPAPSETTGTPAGNATTEPSDTTDTATGAPADNGTGDDGSTATEPFGVVRVETITPDAVSGTVRTADEPTAADTVSVLPVVHASADTTTGTATSGTPAMGLTAAGLLAAALLALGLGRRADRMKQGTTGTTTDRMELGGRA